MTAPTRILVVGASGQLGGEIARRLRTAGLPVRAMGRSAVKLRSLADAGAEVVAADLLDLDATRHALEGVDQIVSTANNVMGEGTTSPLRVDVAAYRNLTVAAKDIGTRRLIHVSARNIGPESAVDFFRVKSAVEGVVRAGGVPYVLLRPSAFMGVWTSVVLGPAPHPTGATLFGGGQRRMNFIAETDVVSFVLAIVRRDEIRNEVIELGGPSDATLADVASLAERALGTPLRRRAVPAPVLRVVRRVAGVFSERVSRMVSLGYWTTLEDRPFAGWREAADRFGVRPRTLEDFLVERYHRRASPQ